MNINEYLKNQKLLSDGAFGTYYAQLYDTKELPEPANTNCPERVRRIHEEYAAAGAQIIRSNTFACNTYTMNTPIDKVKDCIRHGFAIAKEIAAKYNIFAAADIGQIPQINSSDLKNISDEYIEICRTFLEEGAEIFVFETFSDIENIREAIDFIGDKAFIIVQFSVNQYSYSDCGFSARKLIQRAQSIKHIDAVGFNCGIGPAHMQQIIKNIPFSVEKWLTALPNAGYPQYIGNRMIFDTQNISYFAQKVCDIAADGADIVGGCCGTTPEYIRTIKEMLNFDNSAEKTLPVAEAQPTATTKDYSFFCEKGEKKLIAVELAPPLGSDDEKLMDAAHLLKKSGVDVLTFPDSPSGRTRADSVLMAEKVARETGMCVMPHICCRDKNAIAMRSQLLGAHINGIYNFLVVTGDPVPSMVRNSVKSVFNFDSVGLMNIMSDMNDEQFASSPICYGGAINQGRRNIDLVVERVKKKMSAGATFFLTQPICTKENAERVKYIKNATGARILCGIMPFVSLKNATFMKNEMTGIEVTDEVLSRYRENMTRQEGEEAGIQLAREMMSLTEDFADGYYFSFPFNRVEMLKKILSD